MSHTRIRRTGSHRALATATASALVFVLTACASDDGPDSDPAADPVELQPDSSDPQVTGSPDAAPPGMSAQMVTLVSAGRTAEEAVSGASVIHIDLEDNGEWEIDVATIDGTEHELRVSADGSRVVQGPREGDTDQDDKRETAAALDRAQIDFEEALEAFMAEVGEVEIEEISLDLDDNAVTWEIDVINGDDYEVDAATAAVMRT